MMVILILTELIITILVLSSDVAPSENDGVQLHFHLKPGGDGGTDGRLPEGSPDGRRHHDGPDKRLPKDGTNGPDGRLAQNGDGRPGKDF